LALCSGCFGEGEEDEGFGGEMPEESEEIGDSNKQTGESRTPPRGYSAEDQFEVLVGADHIVEIRWVGAMPLASSGRPVENEAFTRVATRGEGKHSHVQAARNYRTLCTVAYGASKSLLSIGLVLFSVAALTLWFLLK
jgi:hypothetical protein